MIQDSNSENALNSAMTIIIATNENKSLHNLMKGNNFELQNDIEKHFNTLQNLYSRNIHLSVEKSGRYIKKTAIFVLGL